MILMEMSITRALNEVKLLEKRINDKVRSAQFIKSNKKSNKKIDGSFTIDEFNTKAKSDYDSIVALIARKKAIKTLIVESNAKTKLEIGGVAYSVADAIERKKSIYLDQLLLQVMNQQYNRALMEITQKNEQMEDSLNKQLETMLGSDNKKTEGATAYSDSFREQNSFELIDGLKLKEKIQKLQEEIDEFENNADFCLSESNAITKVEIPE